MEQKNDPEFRGLFASCEPHTFGISKNPTQKPSAKLLVDSWNSLQHSVGRYTACDVKSTLGTN